MPDINTKVIVGTAVAVGTITAASLAYFYATKKQEAIPTKWKKVGQLVDMNCFVVKSCAPIRCDSFDCHVLGFEYEGLFDRCFILSENDKQVTGKMYPKMVLIQPKVVGNELTLSAPGMRDFVLNLEGLREGSVNRKVEMYFDTMRGVDCGDEVADWFSEYIFGKKGVFRLMFYPYSYATKGKKKNDRGYKAFKYEDTGAYHNKTSYILINQGSIDELNTHLDHVVKPLQFRPSLVVEGPEAYAEDNWKWVRIGESVIFQGLMPCTRCPFTNINPETGECNPERQPFVTLVKKRSIIKNESPVMGSNLGIRIPGKISIGDDVYINDDTD